MLFKTTDKLLEYAQLTNVNFISVKATIRMVEEQHIIPVISQELYTALNEAYAAAPADETGMDARYAPLLDQCRCVIAPYLCYYYAPKAEVSLSDGGVRREETGTSKSAYQYQVTKYREQNLREGEMATEGLMQFLEDKKADYSEWSSSDAFDDYKSLFIKSGKEFQKLFPSHSPYRNYQAMRPKMMDVEELNIRTALGDVLYDDLKTKDTTDVAFTDKETIFLQKLKKAIANFTVAYSIAFLSVRLDVNGLTVAHSNRTENDDVTTRDAAKDSAMNAVINTALDNGKTWLANAIQYLNDNTADFTGWPITPPDTEDEDDEDDDDDEPDEHTTLTPINHQCSGGSFGMF